MRGKVQQQPPAALGTGITPAYAGKSHCCGTVAAPDRDHPRVCGEKSWRWMTRRRATGSPPRMRGKVKALDTIRDNIGITPAYAGKSVVLFIFFTTI